MCAILQSYKRLLSFFFLSFFFMYTLLYDATLIALYKQGAGNVGKSHLAFLVYESSCLSWNVALSLCKLAFRNQHKQLQPHRIHSPGSQIHECIIFSLLFDVLWGVLFTLPWWLYGWLLEGALQFLWNRSSMIHIWCVCCATVICL